MALTRKLGYRRSFNTHARRAVTENKDINADECHAHVKELKQHRRKVRDVLWEWLDPKSRDGVDDKFRSAIKGICETAWYFEKQLNIQSPSTQRAVDELEENHRREMRTIRGEKRELENELTKEKKIRLEEEEATKQHISELERVRSDNKTLSDRCEGYRKLIDRLQKQISVQEEDVQRISQDHQLLQQSSSSVQRENTEIKTSFQLERDRFHAEQMNVLTKIQKLEENLKEKDQALNRLSTQQMTVSEENKMVKNKLVKGDETIASLSSQQSQLAEEKKLLQNELRKREDTIASLSSQQSKLAEEKKLLQNELRKREDTIASLYQDGEKVQEQIEYIRAELHKKTSDISKQQNMILRLREEEGNLRNTIDRLQQHLAAEKHAKEDALTRLSAAAANKLRDNNPGITDLSDPNRPMKLAEKISELYDNEWTNAMENMEDHGIEEEEGVQILIDILSTVFMWCKDGGNEVMNSIENYIAVPSIEGMNLSAVHVEGLPKIPAEILKPLKDFRKVNCQEVIKFIQKILGDKLKDTQFGQRDHVIEDCKDYIDRSIEYCWMMRIQDPPVHIEWEFPVDSEFDTNRFRSYTKGGDFVEYVVWPVLYLHENGPLLAKGVVQGKRGK